MDADADSGQVLAVVDLLCPGDGAVDDVVDAAQREGVIEEVGEQLGDAAEGAVAEQGQAQDEAAQPGLGNGQPEEQVLWRRGRVKGPLDPPVGFVQLPIDELAADAMLQGNLGDGQAGKGGEGKSLTRPRIQQCRDAGVALSRG